MHDRGCEHMNSHLRERSAVYMHVWGSKAFYTIILFIDVACPVLDGRT